MSAQVLARDLDPSLYMPFVSAGTTVDIYGRIEVSDMLPQVMIVPTRIVPTQSGECGPTPITPASWGSVKTLYR